MKNTTLPSIEDFKKEAKQLREKDETIKGHMNSLHILARKYGYKNWNTIRPELLKVVHIDPVWTPERSTF